MPVGKLKGGTAKSSKEMKRRIATASGSGALFRIGKDSEETFRFLTEPVGEWREYVEHYEDGRGYYPCQEGNCVGCDNGIRGSKKWLAAAVNVKEGRVVALALPGQVAEKLLRRYDKYHTLMDRDYTISREGSGVTDTRYDVEAEAPKRRDLSRFEDDVPDLEKLLLGLVPKDEGDDEDDEEEEEEEFLRPRKKAGLKVRKSLNGGKAVKPGLKKKPSKLSR